MGLHGRGRGHRFLGQPSVLHELRGDHGRSGRAGRRRLVVRPDRLVRLLQRHLDGDAARLRCGGTLRLHQPGAGRTGSPQRDPLVGRGHRLARRLHGDRRPSRRRRARRRLSSGHAAPLGRSVRSRGHSGQHLEDHARLDGRCDGRVELRDPAGRRFRRCVRHLGDRGHRTCRRHLVRGVRAPERDVVLLPGACRQYVQRWNFHRVVQRDLRGDRIAPAALRLRACHLRMVRRVRRLGAHDDRRLGARPVAPVRRRDLRSDVHVDRRLLQRVRAPRFVDRRRLVLHERRDPEHRGPERDPRPLLGRPESRRRRSGVRGDVRLRPESVVRRLLGGRPLVLGGGEQRVLPGGARGGERRRPVPVPGCDLRERLVRRGCQRDRRYRGGDRGVGDPAPLQRRDARRTERVPLHRDVGDTAHHHRGDAA